MKKIDAAFDYFQQNSTRYYLVLVAMALTLFAIIFSNAGFLPLKTVGDFTFLVILGLALALYRPSWTFAFLIGSLVLENVGLAPELFHFTLRPYQFFSIVVILALMFQIVNRNNFLKLPNFGFADLAVGVFVFAGFLSSFAAQEKSLAFKQSIIAASFAALYFLVRVYLQKLEDLKKIAPFFLATSLVSIFYAIWQNVRFSKGAVSYEAMLGRPNATFAEADWLGMFLAFLMSVTFAIIYYLNKKNNSSKHIIFNEFSILKLLNYIFLVLILIALILTVSRSAWLGGIIVTLGFLKASLLDGSWKFSNWKWKSMFVEAGSVGTAFFVSILAVYLFGLTNFQLGGRVASAGGMQKITIACPADLDYVIPQNIKNLDEIKPCRHINLEDIEKEKSLGNVIEEVYRPDPNVGIRAKIYRVALEQIKAHPIFGIGWGNIGRMLGIDERGSALNASNILLESWLGAGLLGFLSIVFLLAYLLFSGIRGIVEKENEVASIFVLLGLFAIMVPNLFNSGIFLGFVWAFLAVSVSLMQQNKSVIIK